MKMKRYLILIMISFVVLAAQARVKLQKLDHPDTAPLITVGMVAPDFTLEDTKGQKVNLAAESNKQTVVLVFYRGYW